MNTDKRGSEEGKADKSVDAQFLVLSVFIRVHLWLLLFFRLRDLSALCG
jgi:hypothetical protein